MKLWQGTLSETGISEPIQSKFDTGTYQNLTLIGTDGFKIKTTLNKSTEALRPGDEVTIRYQEITKTNGNGEPYTFNKLLSVDLMGTSSQANAPVGPRSQDPMPQATPQKALYSPKENGKGAMKGNSVTNTLSLLSSATALAVARQKTDKSGLEDALNDLIELTKTKGLYGATEIVNIHKALEALE